MDRSEREHDPRGFLRTVTRRNAAYSLAPSLRSLDSERERERESRNVLLGLIFPRDRKRGGEKL